MCITEQGAHCSKEVAVELSTIVIEDVSWNAKEDDPIIKEDRRTVCGYCLRLWNSSRQLGISICNYKYELATL